MPLYESAIAYFSKFPVDGHSDPHKCGYCVKVCVHF